MLITFILEQPTTKLPVPWATNHKYYFHTHVPAAQTIHHLEKNALTGDRPTKKPLTDLAASHRNNAIQLIKAVIAKEAPLKFHIQAGGKMTRKAWISFYFKNACPVLNFSNFILLHTYDLCSMLPESTSRTEQKKSKYFLFWNSRDDPCPNVSAQDIHT